MSAAATRASASVGADTTNAAGPSGTKCPFSSALVVGGDVREDCTQIRAGALRPAYCEAIGPELCLERLLELLPAHAGVLVLWVGQADTTTDAGGEQPCSRRRAAGRTPFLASLHAHGAEVVDASVVAVAAVIGLGAFFVL
jgi:hypothetical protein